MHILALGLNHRTAPVEVREKLAFPDTHQPRALQRLTCEYGLREAAILSTCNRCEVYVASEGEELEGTRRFLAAEHGVDPDLLWAHCYVLVDGDAAAHLFRVACGIDSLVVGESQILSQVRACLVRAQECGSARLLLNELFRRSLHVGKRARTETDIGRGRLSIATAAVELAGQVFEDLRRCRALLLGAGEMGELTAQYLVDGQVQHLRVANRTPGRAADLAHRFGGEAVPFEALPATLAEVDIVVSSTAAPGFVIGPEMVRQAMHRRRGRPLFLIDIAVPRDVDPQVRGIGDVYLFDIDDLQQVVAANRQEREAEVRRVEALVAEERADFVHWLNALDAGPLIRDLRARADELRRTELERWNGKLSRLSPQERELVEGILRGYANKLLHEPLVQVREFANGPDGYVQLDTVRRLFGLRAGSAPDP
ncbi:MAG: glutamyl-tRNA reductase [Candidatus Latescibacterota bacterium]